jgi:hypothetical protein
MQYAAAGVEASVRSDAVQPPYLVDAGVICTHTASAVPIAVNALVTRSTSLVAAAQLDNNSTFNTLWEGNTTLGNVSLW